MHSGMAQSPDYILEIGGVEVAGPEGSSVRIAPSMRGRPWLSVHWRCCKTYSRIYRNPAGTAYHGWCPKCGKPAHARIGPGGTPARFFYAH